MLHRFEDVVINPLVSDIDFSLSKLMLLKQYGFTSEELMRDPLNFFLKYGNYIPLDIGSMELNNLVATMDEFTSSSLQARWCESYNQVFNKIPLANFANVYYEIWALMINRYRLAIVQYINKLNHILLCEGVFNQQITINTVFGNDGSDVLINSNFVILRFIITAGE